MAYVRSLDESAARSLCADLLAACTAGAHALTDSTHTPREHAQIVLDVMHAKPNAGPCRASKKKAKKP